MNDDQLAELYFRTTLELADTSGALWRITPDPNTQDDPSGVLAPYCHAFILTAENPESLGEYSAEQNARATVELGQQLAGLGIDYRECPGFGFDTDHVEHGFALLGDSTTSDRIRDLALNLARSYRQNAIFHLNTNGLAIIGALRPTMAGTRSVRIEPA